MQRIIVVNADDLGVSRGATLGIIRAHREGVVTSASISPTGADYENALEQVEHDCPELGIGLHFTLSAGSPISDRKTVPDLVDDSGCFKWEFISLLRVLGMRSNPDLLEQIDIELESQIQKLKSDGIVPDHLNSERHVHLIPGVFERVVNAARRHRIPFVRAAGDFSLALVNGSRLKPIMFGGGILKYLLLETLRLRGLSRVSSDDLGGVRFCDQFASYLFTGRLDLVMADILEQAPEGITEIMVHPGVPDKSQGAELGNPGLLKYLVSQDRQRELDSCIAARGCGSQADLCSFGQLASGMGPS